MPLRKFSLLNAMLLVVMMLAVAASGFAAQSAPPASHSAIQLRGKNYVAQNPFTLIVPQNLDSMETFQHRNLDKGIYAPTYADGKSVCAAIMSYNFTPGDNPELKNVTTCTPARPRGVYRTDDQSKRRPRGPVLQMISAPHSVSPQ